MAQARSASLRAFWPWLGAALPSPPLLWLAVLLSALLNLTVSLGRPASARIDDREATVFLAFDILQLGVLLYLTGGLINPFSLLLLAPVAIGATILSLRSNIALSMLTIVSIALLGIFHQPLPWRGPPFELPEIYQTGAWAGLTLTTRF